MKKLARAAYDAIMLLGVVMFAFVLASIFVFILLPFGLLVLVLISPGIVIDICRYRVHKQYFPPEDTQ